MRLSRFIASSAFVLWCAMSAGGCYWRPPPAPYVPPLVYSYGGVVYPTYYNGGRSVYVPQGGYNIAPIYRPPPVYGNPSWGGGGGWRGGWGGWGHRFR